MDNKKSSAMTSVMELGAYVLCNYWFRTTI